MRTTETEWGIEHLDFPSEVRCTGKTCPNPAAHLVRITPGPTGHPHDAWYPTCSEHVVHLSSGHAKCVACHAQIALVATRDL